MTFIIAFAAIVGAAFLFIAFQTWFNSDAQRAKDALSGETQLLAGAKEGEVLRVAGRLRPVEAPLVAPLSKRPCAYWQVEVVISDELNYDVAMAGRHRSRLDVDRRPGGTFVIRDGQDFELIDDDGDEARVRMERATVRIDYDRCFESDSYKPPTAAMRELINNNLRVGGRGLSAKQTIRYREGILEADERVIVRGRCRHDVAPGSGYRDMGHRIEIVATVEEGELFISDDPKLV